MSLCGNPVCQKTIILEMDGSPPLFCTCCGWSIPTTLFIKLVSSETCCQQCGQVRQERTDSNPSIFCSRCGIDRTSNQSDDFDSETDKYDEETDMESQNNSFAIAKTEVSVNLVNCEDADSQISYIATIVNASADPYGVLDGVMDGVLDGSDVSGSDYASFEMPSRKDSVHSNPSTAKIITEVKCENVKTNEISLFLCYDCDRMFTSSISLTEHKTVCTAIDRTNSSNTSSNAANNQSEEAVTVQDSVQQKYIYCNECNQYFSSDKPHQHPGNVESKRKSVKNEENIECQPNSVKKKKPETKVANFKCELCYVPHKTAESLQTHMDTHFIEKLKDVDISIWKCRKCNYFSKDKSVAKDHEMRHLPKRFRCEVCSKMFRDASYMRDHMNIHTGNKGYNCEKCGKGFNTRSQFSRHRRSNCKKFKYTKLLCPHCGKSVTHLACHINAVHLRLLPFPCDICGKKFSKKTKLVEHIRVHTGEKPYKCDFCDYGSKQRGYLTIHMSKCKSRPAASK